MAKKSAVYKDYNIDVENNGSISVYKNDELCSNSMATMREISKQCRFTIDENWNTRQTGSKLIDFLNSKQPTEQNNSEQKGTTKGNTIVVDFLLTTPPNRPVYVLETYAVPYNRFASYKPEDRLGPLMEELSYYAGEKGCSNTIVLMDCSDSYPTPIVARLQVVESETDEVLFQSEIKMNESWIPKISSDMNNEEKKSLQRVRQTIENSRFSINNPMGEALVETLDNIRTKDNFPFLPSLLKSICKKEDKEQNDNTPYILGLAEYPQVELRYRFEVDKDKFTDLVNPAFWRLDEPGIKLPSLGEMSLDRFTTGNYYILNVLEEKETDVICTCSNVYYDERSVKRFNYCFVNNKLEEIGASKEVSNRIEKEKAEEAERIANRIKNSKNKAIVRIKDKFFYMEGFDVPCLCEDSGLDEGDEYVTFSFPIDWEDEFEVVTNGKVFTYTLEDCVPEGVDIDDEYYGSVWEFFEDSDEAAEKCRDEEWDEVESELYDDELEYTIPLKDGEEFDPKKLRFLKTGEYFHDYADAWYIIYDGKKIEESSGIIDYYLQ